MLTDSRVERNARAGMLALGAAVSVGATAIECNLLDLDAEANAAGVTGSFTDLGGSSCGCGDERTACSVKSAGLSPPEPLPAAGR